jgi:pimeloyl-ACP methyl ester carboxylesterase
MIMQRLKEFVQRNQPVAYTGVFTHTLKWLTSPFITTEYKNPRYHNGDNGTVIYCIHGTFDGPAAFSDLAQKLLANGLPEHISEIRLVSFTGRYQGNSIEFFANQLAEQIANNQHSNVILFGHSRGGLVAAYCAEYLASAKNIKVHSVLAISTPFKGSTKAISPLTKISTSVEEMQPNSPFLRDLSPKIATSTISYHYFAAKDDALVQPEACCIDEHRNRMITMETSHGHLSILSSNKLVAFVQEILELTVPANTTRSNMRPASR